MTKKSKITKWIVFAGIMLIIQLIAEIVLICMTVKTKMLPQKYIILVIIGLIFVEFIVFSLIYVGQNRKKIKGTAFFRRIIGTVLSTVMIFCCVLGTYALNRGMGTLNRVTDSKKVEEDKVAVYVMDNDSAQTIDDAKKYKFAYTKSYGYEDTKNAIEDINEKIHDEIDKKSYASAVEMVEALYSGETKAMILNRSYESVITDVEGYEDFSSRTRIIYEYTRTYEVDNNSESEQKDNDIDVTEDAFIVYISGSDTRSKKLTKSRSDVNILAIVNPKNHQILLLNTSRDYYVEPSIAPGEKDKLTHCGLYGIDCSMDTLKNLYGLNEINYYGQINFTGLETLVDEIGGITINSDSAFQSTLYPQYKFVKGENDVKGEKALAFARERYALGDGDNARGRHQMEIIKAVIEKMTSSTALLTNYSGIMDSLEGMISTDFASDDISSLINKQLSDGGTWDIKTFATEGEGASKKTYSMPTQRAYVCVPDESSVQQANQLIKKVMNGETISDDDLKLTQKGD